MKMVRPCREWLRRHPSPYQAEDSGDHKSCSQFLPGARRPYSSSARLAGKNSRAASKCVCPGMCMFLDAGMPRRSTRLGGRRSKSAKARNRGKGYVLRCGVRYRELSSARNFGFEAGRFSPAASLECVYNFGVMARGLLNGDLRFRLTRDFKDLGVAKRPHSTTSTR